MCSGVKRSNSRYLFVGDLASDGAVWYHLVIYGRGKFVSKNVSKSEDLNGNPNLGIS
jgi:hypothetical protein